MTPGGDGPEVLGSDIKSEPSTLFISNPTRPVASALTCGLLFQMYSAVGMAMMVHPNCWLGCCHPPTHSAVRQREKRETASWAAEYENPGDWTHDCCPVVAPLPCICNNFDCDYPEGPWWRTPLRL